MQKRATPTLRVANLRLPGKMRETYTTFALQLSLIAVNSIEIYQKILLSSTN